MVRCSQTSIPWKIRFRRRTVHLDCKKKGKAVNIKIGRLSVALLSITVSFACCLATTLARAQDAPGVRMKLEDFANGPDGAKRVASLNKAVAKMKALDNSTNPQDFRRSWLYW